MRLHDLKPNPGAKSRRKRLGCGESSGHGKTSGRGHKGQKARAGGGVRIGFEGGQMPLHRRLPKKGFNNAAFTRNVAVVSLSQLEAKFEDGAEVSEESLRAAGLVKGRCDAVKVLANGEITRKLTLTGIHASAAAREQIEKAGGSVAP